MKEEGAKWRDALSVVVSHVNNRPFEYQVTDEGTTLTPFNVFRGRLFSKAPFLSSHLPTQDPRPNEKVVNDNLVSILSEQIRVTDQFEEIWKKMRENSFTTIEKRLVREISWKVGDSVMVYIPARARTKLDSRWRGPFIIEQVLSETIVVVDGNQESTYNLKKVEPSKEHEVQSDSEPARKMRRVRLPVNAVSMTCKSGVVLLW